MPTPKETLAEAKRQLKMNLSLLEQLKGNTADSMLTDFRLRYVTPLKELIEHLEQDVRRHQKTDK